MLNLFAASGHIDYAKSSWFYLQLMMQLPLDYPWLYQCFIEKGYHTISRRSKVWAGLWTDLTIEQVMMRSIKGSFTLMCYNAHCIKGYRLKELVESFKLTKGFPQAIGAIDGTHIPIIRPEQSPADYYNRKGYYSIIMQGVVDF